MLGRHTERMCLVLRKDQVSTLRSIQEQAQIPVSEFVRRVFDHCLRPEIVNELLPTISGSVVIRS